MGVYPIQNRLVRYKNFHILALKSIQCMSEATVGVQAMLLSKTKVYGAFFFASARTSSSYSARWLLNCGHRARDRLYIVGHLRTITSIWLDDGLDTIVKVVIKTWPLPNAGKTITHTNIPFACPLAGSAVFGASKRSRMPIRICLIVIAGFQSPPSFIMLQRWRPFNIRTWPWPLGLTTNNMSSYVCKKEILLVLV